jgi:hypothetical protein
MDAFLTVRTLALSFRPILWGLLERRGGEGVALDLHPSKKRKKVIMVPFLVLFPVLTAMVFVVVERRTRTLWQRWEAVMVGPHSPYRSMAQGGLVAGRAPARVRASALTSVLLGSAVVPGVVYAMVKIRYDGIALSLLPEIASTCVAWCAGWLLLARVRIAPDLCRLSVIASRTNAVMLVVVAILHTVAAAIGWSDRVAPGYACLAIGLAAVALTRSVVQSRMAVPSVFGAPDPRRGDADAAHA